MLGGQALRSLRKTPALTSIMVVMACMVAVSVFAVFAVNLTAIGRQLQSQVQIRVFLDQNAAAPDKEALGLSIKALPGVTKVEYVSKDEALSRLRLRIACPPSITIVLSFTAVCTSQLVADNHTLVQLHHTSPQPIHYELIVSGHDHRSAAHVDVA